MLPVRDAPNIGLAAPTSVGCASHPCADRLFHGGEDAVPPGPCPVHLRRLDLAVGKDHLGLATPVEELDRDQRRPLFLPAITAPEERMHQAAERLNFLEGTVKGPGLAGGCG